MDMRLRYYSIAFGSVMFLVLVVVGYFSCNQPRPIPAIIGERTRTTRDTSIVVKSLPVQKIDTVTVVKTVWKTKTTIQDRIIIDTVGYIAISDTIKGDKGTKFIVHYDTDTKHFAVPYLQERADTVKTITDSVIIERTVEAKGSFWSDAAKIAGGFVGGVLFQAVVK